MSGQRSSGLVMPSPSRSFGSIASPYSPGRSGTQLGSRLGAPQENRGSHGVGRADQRSQRDAGIAGDARPLGFAADRDRFAARPAERGGGNEGVVAVKRLAAAQHEHHVAGSGFDDRAVVAAQRRVEYADIGERALLEPSQPQFDARRERGVDRHHPKQVEVRKVAGKVAQLPARPRRRAPATGSSSRSGANPCRARCPRRRHRASLPEPCFRRGRYSNAATRRPTRGPGESTALRWRTQPRHARLQFVAGSDSECRALYAEPSWPADRCPRRCAVHRH